MFKALLAVAALLAAMSPAYAGIVTPAQKLEQQRASVEAAYATLALTREAAVPLIDYAEASLPDRTCTSAPPKTYALLIGVDSAGPTANLNLKGAENDLDLISAAFASRLGKTADIITLKGAQATRDSLRQSMLNVLGELNCHDLVVFFFGGVGGSFDTADLAEVKIAADAIPRGDPSYEHARVLSTIIGLPSAFYLSSTDGANLHPFTANDLSDFVANVRNRGADIVVAIDALGSSQSNLLAKQRAIDPVSGWTFGGRDAPAPGAVTLVPDRGDFVAYYSALNDRHAIERKFTMPDGSEVTHGEFTFALAEALQDSSALTAEGLAGRLKATPDEAGRGGTFQSEGSNPDMLLFGRAASLDRAAAAIHVTSPEPTRGPTSVTSQSIDVSGTVSWTSPATAVLVNGEIASLGSDGRFTRKVALSTGANTIKIVALTRDNLLLQKSFDVVFSGDVDALKGGGKRYAVIIGNADYGPATGFNALTTPVADADALEMVLTQKYGFVTEAVLPSGQTASLSLRNASGRDTAMALYNVSQVAGDNDTVLIYYAGHGIYEPMTTTAFWVPTDAVAGVPPTYLSASTISEAIARIQARKVILISDSCFSGALLRGGPAETEKIAETARIDSLLALQKRKSRILISSGNNEPVADEGGNGHSVFAQALLNGLGAEDHDEFSARELFDDYILAAVTANSKQEPQFRPLDNVGHDGGDVVFVRAKG